ncbi:hypothetical protein [Actinospica robiniae]|uniref:hypothetical protein n=1 Tax=Actinospica robiniae TaxID=304901 RepID=UPI00041042D0|nr:hypothetical protein [Actinospica robiniae]
MDRSEARILRELLEAGRGRAWLDEADDFAAALRAAPRQVGGLLLVGPGDAEPWHMTAHLSEDARLLGLDQLVPTLVRAAPEAGAPTQLSVGLDRISSAGRSDAVLLVAADDPESAVLERVADAKKHGARILTLGQVAPLAADLAHDALAVPQPSEVMDLPSFDGAQHLVSAAAVDGRQRGLILRLRRWIEAVNGPRVDRW